MGPFSFGTMQCIVTLPTLPLTMAPSVGLFFVLIFWDKCPKTAPWHSHAKPCTNHANQCQTTRHRTKK